MDDRTQQLFSSPTAALRAGVPPQALVRVEEKDLIRVTSGPFKGRVYQRLASGALRRRKELEARGGQ